MIYMKTPTLSLLSSFDPENQICGSVAQLWWGRTFCGHRVSFCRKLKLSTDRLRISVLNAFSSVSIKGLGFAWANRDYFEEVATGDLHLLHNTSACVEGPYLHGFLTLFLMMVSGDCNSAPMSLRQTVRERRQRRNRRESSYWYLPPTQKDKSPPESPQKTSAYSMLARTESHAISNMKRMREWIVDTLFYIIKAMRKKGDRKGCELPSETAVAAFGQHW